MDVEKIVEIGRVVKVSKRFAVVEVGRAEACGKCKLKDSCPNASQGKTYRVSVWNECNARVGDDVVIEIPGGKAVSLAFLAYGLPSLLMVLAAFAAASLLGEHVAPIGAVAGLVLGLVIVRLLSPKNPVPKAVLRLGEGDEYTPYPS